MTTAADLVAGRPLVFRNATVLTMDDGHRVLADADVLVTGERIAAVLASFFPTRREFITAKAEEVAWSRLAAGIHFRSDIVTGLQLGRSVAAVVLDAVNKAQGAP